MDFWNNDTLKTLATILLSRWEMEDRISVSYILKLISDLDKQY